MGASGFTADFGGDFGAGVDGVEAIGAEGWARELLWELAQALKTSDKRAVFLIMTQS